MRCCCVTTFIMLITLAGLASCSARNAREFDARPEDLIGKWEGVDRTGKRGAFEFFKDGYVLLIIDESALGGPEANGLGRLTYSVDFAKDPIELDIAGIDPSGNRDERILMIMKFVARDRIKIRTFFNETRPRNFDDAGETDILILDRHGGQSR